jgi:hypothetical protein
VVLDSGWAVGRYCERSVVLVALWTAGMLQHGELKVAAFFVLVLAVGQVLPFAVTLGLENSHEYILSILLEPFHRTSDSLVGVELCFC